MDRDSKRPGGASSAPAEVQVNAMRNDAAVTSLAPGFRFHPSDEELISYYLTRKVQGIPMRLDVIRETDIYKHEPWNLAVHSKVKTKDKEWFFFSALGKKYRTGTFVNRATPQGFWKITGNDREIHRGDGEEIIGMIKSLVFHMGRAPHGRRTNWGMHEYRLAKNGEGLQVDAYVLCKVYLKQNPGEPTGSRYAPFLEQEWDDDGETAVSPVPVLVKTNRISDIQQSQSKNLIVLNELPREFDEIDNDPYPHQKHHDNNKEHDDEALKRESATPLPHCVLDKEAPLPRVQNKRKRQIDSSEITQNHCSSTGTIVDTAAAEPLEIPEGIAISVLKSSFANMIDDVENEQEPEAKMVPASSLTKRIKDLLKEKDEMVVFRETQKREMIEADIVINFLEDKIKTLREENEELRKNKSK